MEKKALGVILLAWALVFSGMNGCGDSGGGGGGGKPVAKDACDVYAICLGSKWNSCSFDYGTQSCDGSSLKECKTCCKEVDTLIANSGLPQSQIDCYKNCIPACVDPSDYQCSEINQYELCLENCYTTCFP